MRLLIFDPAGNGLDLAMRAQRDGHEVRHFIRQTEKTKYIGRGLVEIVDDFRPWLRWADLIFCTDNTKYLRELDGIRDELPIVGASKEAAAWELERQEGQAIFKKHGIPVKEVAGGETRLWIWT